MRLVILGDIVGTPGRLAVTQCLPAIREQYGPDLVIANAENTANGSGLTPEQYRKLCDAGIDAMTLGDHVYKKVQIAGVLEREANIIRPANLSAKAAGKRWMKLRAGDGGPAVVVFTLLGRVTMNMPADDPFATADRLLEEIAAGGERAIVVCEIHAEATSEKVAMGWHLNGRAAVVFGTHTHIPTADARILPNTVEGGGGSLGAGGTAYITDLGMCGPIDSVLGRRVDRVLKHMTTNMPAPFDVAEGDPRVSGIVVDIDPGSRQATAIQRLEMKADVTRPPFAAAR